VSAPRNAPRSWHNRSASATVAVTTS